MCRRRLTALAALAFAAPTLAGADDLRARADALAPAGQSGPFGRPLHLEASASESAPHGEVLARVDHPFADLLAALPRPGTWCAILVLQTNVKRCAASGPSLRVHFARRATDPPQDWTPVDFRLAIEAARPDHLAATLSADHGPLGTRDYALRLEAIPAGAGGAIVRLGYAYATGLAARLAMRAYLATAGRDKVGFSIAGRDAQGRPQYVRGMQGAIERNTMRYFLALDAFLATLGLPAGERLESRLRRFHAALEEHPAQLHETGLDDYLAMKRREAAAVP